MNAQYSVPHCKSVKKISVSSAKLPSCKTDPSASRIKKLYHLTLQRKLSSSVCRQKPTKLSRSCPSPKTQVLQKLHPKLQPILRSNCIQVSKIVHQTGSCPSRLEVAALLHRNYQEITVSQSHIYTGAESATPNCISNLHRKLKRSTRIGPQKCPIRAANSTFSILLRIIKKSTSWSTRVPKFTNVKSTPKFSAWKPSY